MFTREGIVPFSNTFGCPENYISGKLLFINQFTYLDSETYIAPNGKTIFVPKIKLGHVFFIKNLNSVDKITISERTVFKNNKTFQRCEILYDRDAMYYNITADSTFMKQKINAMYFPHSSKKLSNEIRFEYCKPDQNSDLFRYEIYFNEEYLGFASEFGENEFFNNNCNGFHHLIYEESNHLFHYSQNKPIDRATEELSLYYEYVCKRFPLYQSGFLSSTNNTILAAYESSNADELYYIAYNNEKNNFYAISVIDNECKISLITSNDIFKSKNKWKLPKIEGFEKIIFEKNHIKRNLSLDILRGFSLLHNNNDIAAFYCVLKNGGFETKTIKTYG